MIDFAFTCTEWSLPPLDAKPDVYGYATLVDSVTCLEFQKRLVRFDPEWGGPRVDLPNYIRFKGPPGVFSKFNIAAVAAIRKAYPTALPPEPQLEPEPEAPDLSGVTFSRHGSR